MHHRLLEDLENPPAVQQLLTRLCPLPHQQEERASLEQQLKLSYYFGGLDVAYIKTSQGLAIVASGPGHEVRHVLDTLTETQLAQVVVMFPQRWEKIVADYYSS